MMAKGLFLSAILVACIALPLSSESPDIEVVPQVGHSDWIQQVVMSRDHRYVLSGAMDQSIRLWDVESGKLMRVFLGHSGTVTSLAFSPDGKTFLAGTGNGSLCLWEAAREKALWKSETGESVNGVAISPDGKLAASTGDDNKLRLWSMESGKCLRSVTLAAGGIAVDFSGDGKLLCCGTSRGQCVVWNIPANRCLAYPTKFGAIWNISFHGGTGTLHMIGDKGRSALFDLASGIEKGRAVPDRFYCAMSPDGNHGLYDSDPKGLGIALADLASGTDIATFSDGYTGWLSDDGAYALVAERMNDRQFIVVRDIETGRTTVLGGSFDIVKSIAYSLDGRTIAASISDGTIRLWDAKTGSLRSTLSGKVAAALPIAFSPDGKRLASGASDHSLLIWNVSNGSQELLLQGHGGWIAGMAFSPDGRYLLSGAADKRIMLWDLESGQRIREYPGHDDSVLALAFSADGKRFLSGSYDNTMRLWDLESGQILRTFSGFTFDGVYAVAFSPDGKNAMAQEGMIKRVFVWDLETGKAVLETAKNGLTNHWCDPPARYSPDGKLIAYADNFGVMHLISSTTGEEIGILTGHSGMIWAMAFSPDGRQIASGSYDGSIRIWDVASRREIVRMIGTGNGDYLTVTPDGYYAASGDAGSRIAIIRGMEVLRARDFSATFIRPDLIESRLAGSGTIPAP